MRRKTLMVKAQNEELLDSAQLGMLEGAFRDWAARAATDARRRSRRRILLIFLLIRYAGVKLREALRLDPAHDLDWLSKTVICRSVNNSPERRIAISEKLAAEIAGMLETVRSDPYQTGATRCFFDIDPAHVRKKFYELAETCGFDKKSGGPEMLRKARALEMLRNVPLPAVQRLLGHASPNQTSTLVAWSEDDIADAARLYVEKESGRRTSARNSFYGKVMTLNHDAVQTLVELLTPTGNKIFSVITNTSAARLALAPGKLVTAEIKAPWLCLERCDHNGTNSADNILEGIVDRMTRGEIAVECVVGLKDGTQLCAVLCTSGFDRLGLAPGDPVRALFSAYAVILHAD
ncbi:MAG: TOBE domain-containing protein [Desulfovibrio sp.]|jgi:molybdate transport system regulatory protein|nr:TOBE domain-containing protein [Desulfovibrio sp.]